MDSGLAVETKAQLETSFGAQEEFPKEYPLLIPAGFASHMQQIKSSALQSQFIPQALEGDSQGLADPIGDAVRSKGGGIIHRYQNRLLFSPTTKCPINCRYCFRKNELFDSNEIFKPSLLKLDQYLVGHPEVDEVILTGGDPFTLSNQKIKNIMDTLEKFKSVKYLRFHSRFPIVIPSRFDGELLEILEQSSKEVLIAVHCNHVDELHAQNKELLRSLSRLNISMLSQSVLLKGVNDNEESLYSLFKNLADLGVRPYYLHHPDRVKGGMHFYVSLDHGKRVFSKLRQRLSGWMLPHYVVDDPEGTGKELVGEV